MPAQQTYDEKELLQRIAKGDEKSFNVVFERYHDWFYGRAFKLSGSHYFSEELVQEVFVQIWEKRKFLANVENADAYLFKLFYRELHKSFRKLALEKKLQLSLLLMPADENLSTDDMEALQQKSNIFKAAIEAFPVQQAAVFKLIKEDGLSREAAAKQLGISPNTVRNHLAEAIKRLRELARKTPFGSWLL